VTTAKRVNIIIHELFAVSSPKAFRAIQSSDQVVRLQSELGSAKAGEAANPFQVMTIGR